MPSVNKITSKASNQKKKNPLNLCHLWEIKNIREPTVFEPLARKFREFRERQKTILFLTQKTIFLTQIAINYPLKILFTINLR